MLPVEDAFNRLMADVQPLETEKLSLHNAYLRVLAAPVTARRDQPALPLSAMDGYAVLGADLDADGSPVSLKQVGESRAGAPVPAVQVARGACVRVFTGAGVPDGFDQVVPQEQTAAEQNQISVQASPEPGKHIRPAGSDFRDRQVLLDAGTVLTPKSIGLLAAGGHAHAMVHRAVRVALIATGDEIITADTAPGEPHQTVDSATPMIAALLKANGAEIAVETQVGDDAKAIETTITAAKDCDLVITIGGASVGDHDHMGAVLKALGADLDFWKIAMRPGKPLMAGRLDQQRLLGLPGNPVSAFVTALLFARPLVDALMGRPATFPTAAHVPVSADLPAGGPRAHYMRARLVETEKGLFVDPAEDQDSASLSVLAACDGLLVRPIDCPPASRGDRLPFIPF